jgi:hypothetical protein
MFTNNIEYFKSKPVNIPKITILLDHGYHIDRLAKELQKVYPQIMTKVRFQLFKEAFKTGEKRPRKVRVYPSGKRTTKSVSPNHDESQISAFQRSIQNRRKKTKEGQGLSQRLHVGSLNGRMHGWNAVRYWWRTMKEHWEMRWQKWTSVLLG